MDISTAAGLARVTIDGPAKPAFLLVMTHGAAGGVDTKDLLAVRDAAVSLGGAVARVLQPYRVRGARAPGSPDRQDEAWLEIIAALRRKYARQASSLASMLPDRFGRRSAGGRGPSVPASSPWPARPEQGWRVARGWHRRAGDQR